MDSLFIKDEALNVSPAFVGFHIMKAVRANDVNEKSLLDLANELGRHAWYSPKLMHLGLVFLFSIGAVRFETPYVRANA